MTEGAALPASCEAGTRRVAGISFLGFCSASSVFVCGRRFEVRGRASVAHGGRQVRGQHGRPRALDAHDSDVAFAQLLDQFAKVGPIDVEVVDVEHDRPAQEKSGRAGGEIVEPHQPVLEGKLRGQRERKEGSPLEADRPGLG